MSEEKQNYMRLLDEWTERELIEPVRHAWAEYELSADHVSDAEREQVLAAKLAGVKKAVRQRVLESYRNGQKAGPPRPERFRARKQK